jgi:hypothetical protein
MDRAGNLPAWLAVVRTRTSHPRHLIGVAHAGYILSGQMGVRGRDGAEVIVRSGEGFYAAAAHEAWVVGDSPCIALDFPLA